MHGVLLASFNDGHDNTVVWNVNWKTSYVHPDNPDDLRLLNEVICFLIFCGLMSISLLISSKYSSLESDRSKFQIYKSIKKEYEAFQAADSVKNMDVLELCELEPIAAKDRRLFNLLFSPGK